MFSFRGKGLPFEMPQMGVSENLLSGGLGIKVIRLA